MRRRHAAAFASLALAVLALAACGGQGTRATLTGVTVAPASVTARLGTSGVKAVQRATLTFNGSQPGLALDHPALAGGAVEVPLDGRVCYGKNHVDATLAVTFEQGGTGTLTGSFDFWFAPAVPSLTVPARIQGLAGRPLSLPVEVASGVAGGFSYKCPAELSIDDGGTELAPLTLPVPGKGSITLPAVDAPTTLRLGTLLVLGAASRSADKLVEVALVRPAELTLKVTGAPAASVLVSQGGTTVFNDAVTGQTTLSLTPGTYVVDGLPKDGYESPPAQEVALAEGEAATIELAYAPGPQPPVDTGITIAAPAAGATIAEPTFEIALDVADPSSYTDLQAVFQDKGIVASWSVAPGQSRYSIELTVNPELYNGPHSLLVRARTTDGRWLDGPSEDVVIDVPWLGSAYLAYVGFPASQQLYPGRTITLNGTVESHNGFAGAATLTASAPAGVTVQVSPSQHDFVSGESIPVSVTIQTAPDVKPQTATVQLAWADAYDLRSGTQALALQVPNPLQLALSAPPSPVRARPVALTASLPVQETAVNDVEFFQDGASIGKDATAPYSLSWDPGLLDDGEHQIRAVVHGAYGFSADDALTLDLRFPFGVRQEGSAGGALGLAPVTVAGSVFVAASDRVVRVSPADLTLATSAGLGGTLRDLFVLGGVLYAATDTSVARLDPSSLAVTPVASGSGYCCHSEAGTHAYVAFGTSVTSLDGGWTLDVGAAVRSLAADADGLVVTTPGAFLAFTPGGAGPVGRASFGYADLRGTALEGGALQVLDGTTLLQRPRPTDVLLDGHSLSAPSWSASLLDLTAAVEVDPTGATGERLSPAAGLLAGQVAELAQTVPVVPGATYTLSFWYLPGSGAPAPSFAVRGPAGDVVPATPYWTGAAPTSWQRVEASFQAPAGAQSVDVVPFLFDPAADPAVTAWPDGASVSVSSVRLDFGAAAGEDVADQPLGGLCGALTASVHASGWWLGDEAGCVTRVDAGTASRVFDAHAAAVQSVVPVASGRTLVAYRDGALAAVASTSDLELPVAGVPLGFGVNADELVVPYADGTLRRLDGPVWP